VSRLFPCHWAFLILYRYYATSILDHVHRSIALAEWSRLANGDKVSLERALGAFDLFVLHDQRGDLLEVRTVTMNHVMKLTCFEIGDIFDELVKKLRNERPGFDDLTTRKKALAVVSFLRKHNLTGIDLDLAYRDLQNNYIGIALQDRDHPSLPLISVAIFCALAGRLGLDARCCGMPNHVHAMVYPDPMFTVDGRSADDRYDTGPMYLDPYRSDVETPKSHLQETLASWGIDPGEYHRYISDSNAANLVLRTSRNILATVQEFRGQGGSAHNTGHPTIRLHANPFADMDNAFYSALWANFMLSTPTARSDGNNQHAFIPLILERFERLYPMDAALIEQYVYPVLNGESQAERFELTEALRVVRGADNQPKQVQARSQLSSLDRVKYKVGQVFRHKRYTYNAVITGWDVECGMDSHWIAHNNVDSLSRGRNQSFYHAL